MPSTLEDESSNDNKYEFTDCTYSNMQIKEEQDEVPVAEIVSQNTTELTAASTYMTWENYLPIHKELTDLIESKMKEINRQNDGQSQFSAEPTEDNNLTPSTNEFIPEITNENRDSSTTSNVVGTPSNDVSKTKVPETRNPPLKKSVIITLENTSDVEQINIVVSFKSSNGRVSSARLNSETTTVVDAVNKERQTTNTNETSTPVNKTEDVPIAEPTDTPVLIKDATGKQEITVPTLEENKNNTSAEFKSDSPPSVTKNLKERSEEPPQVVLESMTDDVLTNEAGTKRKRKPRKCAENKTSNNETKKNEENSRKRMRKEPVTESNEIPEKKLHPRKKLSNKQNHSTPNKANRGGRTSGTTKHKKTGASRGTTKRSGIYFPTISKEKNGVVTVTEVAEFRPTTTRESAAIKPVNYTEDSDSDFSINSLFDF